MSYRLAFKITTELSSIEKHQVVSLFNKVFRKEADIEWFDRKYCPTTLGYSYHGLLFCDKEVVGTFNAIPYRYHYYGKELTFGLSVDTMIDPSHRGGGHLVRMGEMAYEAMISDEVPFLLGFPNEHYYEHEKRIFATKDIAELDYYMLPLNIGAIVKWARIGNPLSRLLAKTLVGICRPKDHSTIPYPIEKVSDDVFIKHRYDDSYQKIPLEYNGLSMVRICDEDRGVRVAYIIDVAPLNPGTFAEAVRRTYHAVRNSADVIIYVGKPVFSPPGLFRVPDVCKPQRIRMTGKTLIPTKVDDRIFDIRNWNVNISNIDVR
jgi:hypothetical protein